MVIHRFLQRDTQKHKMVKISNTKNPGYRIGQRDILVDIKPIQQESGRDTLKARTEQQAE